MKRIKIFVSLLALVAFASCKKDVPPPPPPEPVVIETPPATPPAPEAPVEQESDGTTIDVGKDGVNVSTKSGNDKTSVKVSEGDAKVEIKKIIKLS